MESNRAKGGKVLKKVRSCLESISEYIPGRSVEEIKQKYGLKRVVKLASNENPYGTSPKVFEVLKNFRDFHIYPKEDEKLLEKLAEYTGFDKKNIVIGNGSDGIMENIFKLFVSEGDEVIIPIPTFSYYHTLASVYCAKVINVRRQENFKISVDKILSTVSDKTKIIFICSPNNPTGNDEEFKDVKEIVESVDCLVFIDEAYVEFSDSTLIDLAEYENVVVSRTFSKAFGLANLRIGYAVMSEELARLYRRVSPPFPVSSLAIQCALAVLEDLDYVMSCVKKIVDERERVYKELLKRSIEVYPSKANFLFMKSPIKSSVFVEELMKRGVIVRDCSNFVGCDEYSVRVSIGKRDENDLFLQALDDFLNSISS